VTLAAIHRRAFAPAARFAAIACLVLASETYAGDAAGGRQVTAPIVSKILPQRTLALVLFENLSATATVFKETAPYLLWSEPAVQDFLGGVVPVAKRVLTEAARSVPELRPDDVLSAFRGQVALAFVDLTFRGAGQRPLPELALLAEVSDHGAASRLVQLFMRSARVAGGAETRTWSVGPVEFGQITLRDELELGYVLSENALYAAIGPRGELLKEIVTTATGDATAGVLASTADFATVLVRAGARRDVVGYFNTLELILTAVGEQAPAEAHLARKVFDCLGLTSIQSVSFSYVIDPPGARTEVFVHAPAPRKGIFALLSGEPVSPELVGIAPKGSRGVLAWRFRPEALVPLVRDLAQSVEPRSVQQIDEALANVNAVFGVDVERQLLRGLGGEGAILLPAETFLLPTSETSAMSGLTDATLVLRVASPEDFRPVFDRLMALWTTAAGEAGRAVGEETGPGGALIRYQSAPLGFTPAVALGDRWLVAGLTKDAVARALATAAVPDYAPSVASDDGYATALERARGTPGFWLCYVAPTRPEEIAPALACAPLVIGGLYAGAAADERTPPGVVDLIGAVNLPRLPPAATITKHSLPYVQVGWVETDGVVISSWGSSLGKAQLVAASALATTGFAAILEAGARAHGGEPQAERAPAIGAE